MVVFLPILGAPKAKRSRLKLWLRQGLLGWVGLILAIVVGSCIPSTSTVLTVGLNDWPGYTIALYGQIHDIFERHGLQVEFYFFNSLQDNIRANLRGALDLSFVSLWDVLQADPGQDSPSILAVVDVSAGADGIVGLPQYQTLTDLQGKRVGCKLGTVSHLILLEALDAAGMEPLDVDIVDVLNPVALEQLKRGQLDAAVLWEPDLSQAEADLGVSRLFSTADVNSLVVDVLATSSDRLRRDPESLQDFLQAWLEIVDAAIQTPEAVFTAIAPALDQSPEAVTANFQGLKVGDRTTNDRLIGSGYLQAYLQASIDLLQSDQRHGRSLRTDISIAQDLWQSLHAPPRP